jgi:hypothetical protein
LFLARVDTRNRGAALAWFGAGPTARVTAVFTGGADVFAALLATYATVAGAREFDAGFALLGTDPAAFVAAVLSAAAGVGTALRAASGVVGSNRHVSVRAAAAAFGADEKRRCAKQTHEQGTLKKLSGFHV